MRRKDQDDLGGLKTEELVVINPQTQVPSDDWNVIISDVAALTNTPIRAWVNFVTRTSLGVYDPNDVTHRSIWGSGGASKPAVERTGAGLYKITYANSFLLGYSDSVPDDETENVTFAEAIVVCNSGNNLDLFGDSRRISVASNIANVGTYAGGALADVGNVSAAVFNCSVFLF